MLHSLLMGCFYHHMRYACVMQWFLLLIRHLCLIGMWLGEDQRTNTIKDTCLIKVRLCFKILTTTPHLIMNAIGNTYIFNFKINKT